MKGPKALKRYVAKYREHLKACHWDDLYVMKLEQLVFAPVRRRKLSEVLDLLPFKHTGAERVRAGVADNQVRTLRVPTGEAEG